MLLGILADTHDHLENTRRLVEHFNEVGCELVLHLGDFVSPIVLPPFRRLRCRLLAVWGDNDGNRRAIEGGLRSVGTVHEPPYQLDLDCRWRLILSHRPLPKATLEQAAAEVSGMASGTPEERGIGTLFGDPLSRQKSVRPRVPVPLSSEAPSRRVLALQAHTHHPGLRQYDHLLLLNPGEACGWVTGQATAALFDSREGRAEVFDVAAEKVLQSVRVE